MSPPGPVEELDRTLHCSCKPFTFPLLWLIWVEPTSQNVNPLNIGELSPLHHLCAGLSLQNSAVADRYGWGAASLSHLSLGSCPFYGRCHKEAHSTQGEPGPNTWFIEPLVLTGSGTTVAKVPASELVTKNRDMHKVVCSHVCSHGMQPCTPRLNSGWRLTNVVSSWAGQAVSLDGSDRPTRPP